MSVIVGADVAAAEAALGHLTVQPKWCQKLTVEVTGPFIERADRVRAKSFTDINEQVEPFQAEALQQVDLHVRNEGFRLDGDGAGVGIERQLDLRCHHGVNDEGLISSPAQDAVTPHQLEHGGFTLKPEAQIVKILIQLACSERCPCLRYPGTPWPLHILTENLPEPGGLRLVISEPVIEISGERGFAIGICYPCPQMGRDVVRYGRSWRDLCLRHL